VVIGIGRPAWIVTPRGQDPRLADHHGRERGVEGGSPRASRPARARRRRDLEQPAPVADRGDPDREQILSGHFGQDFGVDVIVAEAAS
jgi:hypothetical protein